MTKNKWKNKIKKACDSAGVYKPEFDFIILELASILERRDEVEDLYQNTGGAPLVKHTNKGGATNYEKNPLLVMWDNLNKSALAYWRDLGLTPAGLKKLKENSFVQSAGSTQTNDLLEKLRRKREENGRI